MYDQNGFNIQPPGDNKRCSEVTKQKISESKKGTHQGEDNPMYGKEYSKKEKRKISESLGGSPVLHIPSGEVYCSQNEAARKTGWDKMTVSSHCNNKRKTPRFRYVEE